ncbi:MAG: nucleotidyltransferase domain-containing protein [Hyphomicrobiales bacterium]|nr:nucleotidyltransferase domain-containing protein [Hyphomicrobiales bacterium]
MNRDRAINELSSLAGEIRARGAKSLFLYGSTSRDTATGTSDVDLFIDYDPDSHFSAFDLIDIKTTIEERLGSSVDLTTRDGLHPQLRDKIEREAIRVF